MKVYGIIPNKLLASIKKNSEKINGKYLVVSTPMFSLDTPNTNEYISSATDCHFVGINVLLTVDNMKNNETPNRTISINNEEFVNEISIPLNLIGKIVTIENCSSGFVIIMKLSNLAYLTLFFKT